MIGVDYSSGRPGGRAIAGAGFGFVMRYLSTSPWKCLTADELADLHAYGLGVGVVWETTAQRPLAGATAGTRDGALAALMLAAFGAPADMACYFAVDFDAQVAQLPAVRAYLTAAARAVAPHPAGVYGGWRIVADALAAGIPYAWQTAAWSNGRRAGGAHLFQRAAGVTIAGVPCDLNDALVDDFGQWRPSGPVAKPAHPTTTRRASPMVLVQAAGTGPGRPVYLLTPWGAMGLSSPTDADRYAAIYGPVVTLPADKLAQAIQSCNTKASVAA